MNIQKTSWNPVLNLVNEIRNEYIKKFGSVDKYDLKYWISKLNNEELDLFASNVETSNYNNMELIRYRLFSKTLDMYSNPQSIYRECRSIVINLEKMEIVMCPQKKFFNVDEIPEFSMKVVKELIENAKLVEATNKLDGSMQCLRWYNNRMLISGSRAINPKESFRIREGYNRVTPQIRRMVSENTDITFIMEFISLKDKHTVTYTKKQEGLYLIGARSVVTGYEYSYRELKEFADKYNVAMTEIENLTLDDIIEKAKTISATEKEGWVLNVDGVRLKFKTDSYVQLSKILDSQCSPNNVIRALYFGTYDDLISKIPQQYHESAEQVKNDYIEFIDIKTRKVDEYYEDLKANVDMNNIREAMDYIRQNVDKQYRKYVINKYNKIDNNFVCKVANSETPGFILYQQIKDFIKNNN